MELDQERELHRTAVELARKAAGPDRFVAGTLTGTGLTRRRGSPTHLPGSMTEKQRSEARRHYDRRVDQQMSVGVDAFFCESYGSVESLSLVIPAIRESGVPAVTMMVFHENEVTREGHTPAEAAKRLEGLGVDVVGVNCARPWRSYRHIVRQMRKAVSIPVISQPTAYAIDEREVYNRLLHLKTIDIDWDAKHEELPVETRFEMADYAREARAIGVNLIGSCCGSMPYHVRAMAETLGKPVALPDLDRGYRAPVAL